MIVPKLLHVTVQPVFVFVDTDTADVQPGPQVQAANLPAAHLGQLGQMIEQARQQIADQLSGAAGHDPVEGSPVDLAG